ncbi:MAG: ABC transporter permease [Chryseolinea sp.]
MLKNYLVIAIRNIRRTKTYSTINIFGLSMGVACCLLLTLYVQDELSYDKHQNRLDDLYRVTTTFSAGVGIEPFSTTSPPVALTLKQEIPEVENAARILNPPGVTQSLIKYEDKVFYETDGLLADSTMFNLLTYEFIEGSPDHALTDPNTVVITDKLARKLFDNEPALDKLITISLGAPPVNYKITGVVKDNPKTHFHGNFFASMYSTGWGDFLKSPDALNEWAGNNFVPTYLKLVPGADKDMVIKKMNQVLLNHGGKAMEALGMTKTLGLEPVKDIYLKGFNAKSPRITYIYVISSIAIFILVIACINFMNLSTARATKRANEIGVRKVMGAVRSSLIWQIMGEAMIIVLISIVFAVVMVQVSLPFFNQLTAKTINFGSENIAYFIIGLAGVTIVTGVLAGGYPAFYLSSFQPAQVLKGKSSMGNASGLMRRSLVVVQFMIAITLVCGMIIISQQLEFMRVQDLGFDSKAKVIIPLRTESAKGKYTSLKSELSKMAGVSAVSATNYLPGNNIFSDMSFFKDGGTMSSAVNIKRNDVDYGYMHLMGIKLIAGRNFTDNYEMEQNKLILTRSTAKNFGFEPDQAVGQSLHFEWQGKKSDFEIIGVMEDYHQTSMKQEIKPTLFQMARNPNLYDFLVANIDSKNFETVISTIKSKWTDIVSDTPFEYSFLDQDIQKQYDEDKRFSSIITYFTIIAMLISCLGLYGLSSYMAERRFKEIGMRKVLGASVKQIVVMMSSEFVRLIMIALVISVPVAWYGMTQWLNGFAYHIPVNFLVFVDAGGAALLIALITVSFESVKAASSNPVTALRSE